LRYANGDVYNGQWKDGKPDGKGAMRYYANGDFYDGMWKHGKPDGRGVMMYANGAIHGGTWVDGNLITDTRKRNYRFNDVNNYNRDKSPLETNNNYNRDKWAFAKGVVFALFIFIIAAIILSISVIIVCIVFPMLLSHGFFAIPISTAS